MLKPINNTSLDPQSKKTRKRDEYRLISFCNVVYKLISKVLEKWLKFILPSSIVETQSAFVPRRQITTNVMMAYETLCYMSKKRAGNLGFMVFKFHMSKEYERVECMFLENNEKDEVWWELDGTNMGCITIVSSILIYRNSIENFTLLVQGDPLSPYLFLLCA